ncbi:MAG: sulfite exporter TauE/SafE family protein [Thermoplasmata archaeon]
MDLSEIWLAILTFGAAVVNGAVGYGFSSTITPIAILWYSNKVLNPALVTVEVVVNVVMLLRVRAYARATWSRARPVVLTLFPGIVLGTIALSYLAVNDVKLILYVVLLPLVALQLYGLSRPIRNERRGGASIGPGIGFLYALTTISGPPLALFLRNQGLSNDEFRATIAQIRVAESTLTLGTYAIATSFFGAGLFALPSLTLIPYLLIPAILGVPLGIYLLRSVSPEFFRRFIMLVDAIFISYGLSAVMATLKWVSLETSYLVFAGLLAVIGVLAWASFRRWPAESIFDEPPGDAPAHGGSGSPPTGTGPP